MEGSLVIRFFEGIIAWCSTQFQNSRLITGFLLNNEKEEQEKNNFFPQTVEKMGNGCRNLFFALRLNRVFHNSIFQIPYLWCLLTVVIAPIMPTMVVLLSSLAGFGSLALALLCHKGKKLHYFALNKYIYFFGAAYLFATFTSVTRSGSLFGGVLSICFLLFAVVLSNAIETRNQMRFMLFLFIGIGVLVALYGFYQFIFPDKFSGVWLDQEMFEDISFRVYSTLDNPNVLGEYFLLVIPIAFACLLNEKSWLLRLFYLGACGAMMLCLILTYSRGCYIGILVAFAVFLVLLDRRFIFLGIIGLLLLPFVLPQSILNRFLSIGNMADSSTSYRVYIWMGSIAMLKDYWLCGVGPGSAAFNLVYPAYAYNGISAPHAHNLFLQLICDSGIVGFMLFALVIYQFYKGTLGTMSRTPKENKEKRIYLISAASAVTGFMAQSLFDYTFYNYRVMLLFWVVIGMGMVFMKMENTKGEKRHD